MVQQSNFFSPGDGRLIPGSLLWPGPNSEQLKFHTNFRHLFNFFRDGMFSAD